MKISKNLLKIFSVFVLVLVILFLDIQKQSINKIEPKMCHSLSSSRNEIEPKIYNSSKFPIHRVKREEKLVSISFDTEKKEVQHLLDILEKHNIKSTFFLVSTWVKNYPNEVKSIFNAGHDIGNHSSTHPQFSKLSKEKIKNEVEECNQEIESITGKRPILFRFPYGDYNSESIETLRDLNMYPIQWDIDTLDWKGKTCDQMCNRIIPNLKSGSIILFHSGAKYTTDSIETIIERIENEGYKIVPISEIIYTENYEISSQGEQVPNNL